MKIERTPDLLVIDNRPIFIAALLSIMLLAFMAGGIRMLMEGLWGQGLLFVLGMPLFFGVFFALFVRRNQLVLNRQTGELLHRRRTIFGHTETRFELAALAGAEVQYSRSDGKQTRRMAYVLSEGPDAGTHPFTTAYSSGNNAQRAADAVNAWLAEARGETDRAG
ncbi:hypothetical protein [Histidinibacterium lentulum]|uniref:Uncharacterized protein n=1 Tax=Histidinibacterium lentulum TaxID=2480588 RepID=A0A3N2QVW9_9RHOB|nr:hypothetical protein [Histidinibacterium lentulum]ROT99383.1 hypothetical protein EAT49_14280 [Histidinibacterium lentulum]